MMSSKLVFAAIAAVAMMAVTHQANAQTTATGKPAPVRAQQTQERVDQTFKLWDVDKNGSLSKQEFENGWRNLSQAMEMRTELLKQFASVDTNNNKAIDASEYGKLVLIQKAGRSAPPLSSFDENKNQRLEFPEYVALVRQMSTRHTTAPAPAH